MNFQNEVSEKFSCNYWIAADQSNWFSNRIIALACLVASTWFWSAAAYNIECKIEKRSWITIDLNVDTCRAENIKIVTQNQRVTSINGQSSESFQSRNVHALQIFGRTVNYMPVGLEEFFPNLEVISIAEMKLKSIEKSDLYGFPFLKVLILRNGNLESLSNDLFSNNLELQFIVMDGNKIKSVGENTFAKLTKLEYLFFINNQCTSKWAFGTEKIQALLEELKQKCPLTTLCNSIWNILIKFRLKLISICILYCKPTQKTII